jgi:5-carboxymethyl-2-hydroxymuconate isomerase
MVHREPPGDATLPHVTIEYSANLDDRLDVQRFVDAVHEAALATGVFPVGGIRTRAYPASSYRIADGHPDNAFVHVVLRVGPGRDVPTRKRACESVFAAVCAALNGPLPGLPLGISLEMQEIDRQFAYRQNNLHEFVLRRRSESAGA